MCRDTIIDCDDYTVDLEWKGNLLFLHCDVHNFSKSVLKNMVNDWLTMEEALIEEGFDTVYAVPEDKKGFITYTGWEHIGNFEHYGREREVYKWELSRV